jgi:hypothetical protein
MVRSLALAVLANLAIVAIVRADVMSGPAVGTEVTELTVYGVTGDVQNEDVDFVAHREGKPTLYCFVPHAKWTRQAARLLKALDGRITEVGDDAAVVVVWLTENPEETKEYVPRAQQSLQFENTSMAVCTDDPLGPIEWAVNLDAEVTAIVTVDGEVKKTFGFVSANDTVADDVLEAFE